MYQRQMQRPNAATDRLSWRRSARLCIAASTERGAVVFVPDAKHRFAALRWSRNFDVANLCRRWLAGLFLDKIVGIPIGPIHIVLAAISFLMLAMRVGCAPQCGRQIRR
jgi:hypothetical protein